MRNVLITNVKHYTGPGTLTVLLREGANAFCHDMSFKDGSTAGRSTFTTGQVIYFTGGWP